MQTLVQQINLPDLGLLGLRSTNSKKFLKFNCNLTYTDLQVGQVRGRLWDAPPTYVGT